MIANQRAVARPDSICNARAELDAARQAHMRAVQMALAAGMPAAEIEHDTQSFTRAIRQLMTICTMPSGHAPMILGALS